MLEAENFVVAYVQSLMVVQQEMRCVCVCGGADGEKAVRVTHLELKLRPCFDK